MNQVAIPFTQLEQIAASREKALSMMDEATSALELAFQLVSDADKVANNATNGSRAYRYRNDEDKVAGILFGQDFNKSKSMMVYKRTLDANIWTYLMDHTGIQSLMDSTAKEEWRKSLSSDDVPEANIDNLKATFEQLYMQSNEIFLRGLSKSFSKLDRRFKSHDGFKVGSRIIITRLLDDSGYWNYYTEGDKTFEDIERIFALLDKKVPKPSLLRQQVEESRRGKGYGPRQGETETEYFRIKTFMNGNAHLWMTRDDLVEKVNKKLAEYYGEVLPDAPPKDSTPDIFENRSNLPSKDLAFYPTSNETCKAAFRNATIFNGSKILEPSAGTGGIIRYLINNYKDLTIDAVEIHPQRAEMLKGIDYDKLSIRCANFLSMVGNEEYDVVAMNPPFAGTHWMDHVMHAWTFVKPGGKLYAILPVTAEIGETSKHIKFREWADKMVKRNRYDTVRFSDLPEGSFREVGVNINTVVMTMEKPR